MARRRTGLTLNGWLVIDKPTGMTSGDVVNRVRRLTRAAKVGHAGTLDPLATGVLPLAFGEATKCMDLLMGSSKCYRFTLRWGVATDSDDSEGQETGQSPVRPAAAEVAAALPDFTGHIEQVPPAFSAIKVAGRRAYDLARQGAAPALAARTVRIDRFTHLGGIDADHADFEVVCGKGTYMRALARDLGQCLGSLAHIVALRRTRVGPFVEQAAISLDKLAEVCDTTAAIESLLPIETALADIPALVLTGVQADRLRCGQAIHVLNAADGIAYATNGNVPVALTKVSGGEVQPVRVFNL